ncbi:MAG: cation:proton antiporter [Candidatus Micrarchaeota archaeon]
MKSPKERIESLVPLVIIGLFVVLFLSVVNKSVFGKSGGQHLFFEISLLLLVALVAEVAVIYLRQPYVMLLLLLGVLMSQSFLSIAWPVINQFLPMLSDLPPVFIADESLVSLLGQMGALFILMRVGLGVKFGNVFNYQNGVVALLGVIVPFIAGYFFAVMTGGNFIYAMFLGASLVATSVGITVAMLKEAGLMKERFAEVILGAAVIDDVLGLIVLSLVSVASSGSADYLQIGFVLANTLIFLVGGVLAGRIFIRKVVDQGKFDSEKLLLVLSFVFVYSYIAEFIGLSGIVGAFLAGILLNGSKNFHKISDGTKVLELVFAPVFFFSLGMMVDVKALAVFFVPILVITAIAVVTKFIGCGIASMLIGLKRFEVYLVGVGMAPRGEVALIIALIGLARGALTQEQYTMIAAMAFLTAAVTPFFLNLLLKRFEGSLKRTSSP